MSTSQRYFETFYRVSVGLRRSMHPYNFLYYFLTLAHSLLPGLCAARGKPLAKLTAPYREGVVGFVEQPGTRLNSAAEYWGWIYTPLPWVCKNPRLAWVILCSPWEAGDADAKRIVLHEVGHFLYATGGLFRLGAAPSADLINVCHARQRTQGYEPEEWFEEALVDAWAYTNLSLFTEIISAVISVDSPIDPR